MTLLQQRKLYVFWINEIAAILNVVGHFVSYIIYYKSESFLMPNKTFVDKSISLVQDIVYVDVYIDFSQSNRGHLVISRHCYLKKKNQRWKHTRHYWLHIDKGFPPCCLLLTKKFRGFIFSRCTPRLMYLTIFFSWDHHNPRNATVHSWLSCLSKEEIGLLMKTEKNMLPDHPINVFGPWVWHSLFWSNVTTL